MDLEPDDVQGEKNGVIMGMMEYPCLFLREVYELV